jgi:hypothetical protein
MSDQPSDLELYKIALDTRNLEIALFWQRSNYFLVLNSALAVGFFTHDTSTYSPVLALAGLFSAFLWLWVSLGSKYWQTRWEQRLMDFERDHFAQLDFFAASLERLEQDVLKGFAFHHPGPLKRILLLGRIPSAPRKARPSSRLISKLTITESPHDQKDLSDL